MQFLRHVLYDKPCSHKDYRQQRLGVVPERDRLSLIVIIKHFIAIFVMSLLYNKHEQTIIVVDKATNTQSNISKALYAV